jgi:hypothetical protein
MITLEQRGRLKELILDNDDRLVNLLEPYKTDRNLAVLYSKILELLD